MKLFRKQKPKNGEEADELFEADAAEEIVSQETADAAADGAVEPELILTPDDPFAQEPSESAEPLSKPDDLLDGGLMDLFREAQSEVQESTLASELPDVPIKDLLNDLVSISQRLGIEPGTGALRRDNARGNDSEHRASRKR